MIPVITGQEINQIESRPPEANGCKEYYRKIDISIDLSFRGNLVSSRYLFDLAEAIFRR
jgi:hypothetical protein